MKTYQRISSLLIAIDNCRRSGNGEWEEKHEERLQQIMKTAPSGSGIDHGVKLLDCSKPNRLMFCCDYHHMDENGGYDGWTEHTAIITPSLFNAFDVRITGRDRKNIKDHLQEVFFSWLYETEQEFILS